MSAIASKPGDDASQGKSKSTGTEKTTSKDSSGKSATIGRLVAEYTSGKIDREQLSLSLIEKTFASETDVDSFIDKFEALMGSSNTGEELTSSHSEGDASSTSSNPSATGGGDGPPSNLPTAQDNPDQPDRRFGDAWIDFVRSIRILTLDSIASLPRYTDQFRQWARQVLNKAESTAIVNLLQEAYGTAERQSAELLLGELLGVNEAIEVAKQTETGDSWAVAHKALLGIAGTTVGSIKDIFSDFLDKNPLLKGVITLISELLSIFRGG
jgi:hypothetical protein